VLGSAASDDRGGENASSPGARGKLVNAVVHTYPNVSQFWKYPPQEFLASPVYSRDFPPAKHLEQ
jgi:hypothetical protein